MGFARTIIDCTDRSLTVCVNDHSIPSVISDLPHFGKRIPVHFAIGKPVAIESASGKEEHEAIVSFIKDHYDAWNNT